MSFMSRRFPSYLIVAVLLPLVLARPVSAQETGDPEAAALLEQSAAAMAEVESFRFRLTTLDGTTTIFEGIELELIEGAVARPDQFTATITAKVVIASISLQVVGTGDAVWVQDPLSGSGEYRRFPVTSGLADLINPDRLFLEALRLIEAPRIAGEDAVDGVATTVIEGEFTPLDALGLVGTPVATPNPEEMEEAGFSLILDEPLFTQIWVDEDGRVIQMAFQGRLTSAEDPGIIRVLRLWDFDQPVEITPPA